jgi:hypothetical protein
MSLPPKIPRDLRRLERQFASMEKLFPSLRRPLTVIRARGWWVIRLPIAVIFILGGLASFLPILGFWMLPVGLLLLAVDLPLLRGPISVAMIKGRRRLNVWNRRRLRKKALKKED